MKRGLVIAIVAITSIILTASIVYAATQNITSRLGGVAGDFFDLDGTMMADSLKVGSQGLGGVTFFNGTIINNTTNDGVDNPVTFGDNVRIDGRVFRGDTSGTDDTMPFIVNDNMEVVGSLTVGSLSGTDIINTNHILDGTIATADLADGAVTQALEDNSITDVYADAVYPDYDVILEKNITTKQTSNLLVLFSGEFQATNAPGKIVTMVTVDNLIVSMRGQNIYTAHVSDVIAHNNLVSVEAGKHTIEVRCAVNNANNNTTVDMFNGTLDVIELKK